MDMMKMLGKVREMQGKLKEAQESLGKLETTAESGGGAVKATVNGKNQVVSLEIDAEWIKPEEKETLQDLIAAAINIANNKMEEIKAEELRKSTEGMLPNIPGMDFGDLGQDPDLNPNP